jgi:prophage tail gpP-like protein
VKDEATKRQFWKKTVAAIPPGDTTDTSIEQAKLAQNFKFEAAAERERDRPIPKRAKPAVPKPVKQTGEVTASSASSNATAGLFVPGSAADRIVLELDGQRVDWAESYEVECAVFTQPATFSMVLGHHGLVKQLRQMARPGKSFRLLINDIPVQVGRVDGYAIEGDVASISIHGRDGLAAVHESYVGEERVFTEKTHLEFVRTVLRVAKIEGEVALTDDAVRRAMITGRPVPITAALEENVIKGPVRSKLGDRTFDFIKRILDRAGLFMMHCPDDVFRLSAPSSAAEPMYQLVHWPSLGGANVTRLTLSENTVDRVSRYIVYGRGTGKKFGFIKHKAHAIDDEMLAWGIERTHTFRDWHVTSDEQCQLMARRKLAEGRRRAFRFELTVPGHTTPAIDSPTPVIWRPDTMVLVKSEAFGFNDKFYIESVKFRRNSGGTTTTLRLMRTADLLFGYEEISP